MEQTLDRKLRGNENVHHKNGVKDDNRIENLELKLINDHSRLHRLGKKMSEKSELKLRLNHNPISDLDLHLENPITLRMKNKQ